MKVARWIKNGCIVLVLAAALHVSVVWLIPRVITGAFLRRAVAQDGYNQVVLPPLPTDTARAVVKPSPDLLYALCIYDIRSGPVRISAKPSEGYWSIALYGSNSDNFFKLNDRELHGDHVELILSDADDNSDFKARHPDAIQIHPTSTVGLMLTRGLVLDPDNVKAVIDARSSTRCEPLKD
jgi:uncharacterized membrane protein